MIRWCPSCGSFQAFFFLTTPLHHACFPSSRPPRALLTYSRIGNHFAACDFAQAVIPRIGDLGNADYKRKHAVKLRSKLENGQDHPDINDLDNTSRHVHFVFDLGEARSQAPLKA